MTEHDSERWLLVLENLRELSAQYQQVVRAMQSGFGTLSLENANIARRLALIETKVDRLDATLQRLLPDLAAIAAYVVRMQAAPRPASKPRRVNGE